MPPPIQIFLTTIASQPALRQRQEYILRILQTKQIPFDSYDLASDEEAKRLWRRKAPADKQQLPGILVGGKCPGSFTDFEEAVEFDELSIFLRRNEDWDPELDESRPTLPVKPIGVPGAASPSQMAKPEHKRYFTPSPQPSPLRSKTDRAVSGARPGDPEYQKVVDDLRRRNEKEFDIGEELSGYGLQGVKVTEDDLLKLVEDLGLEGEEAGDLAKGLSGFTSPAAGSGAVRSPNTAGKDDPFVDEATSAPQPEHAHSPEATDKAEEMRGVIRGKDGGEGATEDVETVSKTGGILPANKSSEAAS